MIDKELLAEIKQRANIIDVISCFTDVKKKGKSYVSLCPFHDDHNPSMTIDPVKGIFKCFSCGAGGDVFTFVEKHENMTFDEAVLRVCEIINFDDPRLHSKKIVKEVPEDIKKLYDCINDLNNYYCYSLATTEGKVARDYLESRQLVGEIQQMFSLGYAPKDGGKAIEYLQQKGYSLKNIEDIGIALARASGTSDNNAGRLIIPLKDQYGQIIGFSARRLDGEKKEKYVNSPETKLFKKRYYLYNLNNAKATCRHDTYIYLVEGFFDVFALAKAGITSAVAIMGTALTDENINLLKGLNVEIRLCLDGDNPGQKAMMGITAKLDANNIKYRVVCKAGEVRDPDEIYTQDGKEALLSYLDSLVSPFEFAINYYKNIKPLDTIENKKKVIQYFAPRIRKIKDDLEYDNYIYNLHDVTGFNVSAIKNYIKRDDNKMDELLDENYIANRETYINNQSFDKETSRELRRLKLAEQALLIQMLSDVKAVKFFEESVKYFYTETYHLLANYIIESVQNNKSINISDIIDTISQNEVENKEKLITLVTDLASTSTTTECSMAELNDFKNVIEETKKKMFQKNKLKQDFQDKGNEEKAKIGNDYIKENS